MTSKFRIGCVASVVCVMGGITAAQQASSQRQVTFTKDIAPILQRSCQSCHRPNSMAPMSLLTYEEVRPWARSIKLKVTARDMPPWFIDQHVGVRQFKDDPSLTDEEIAKVSAWVDAGAPNGNPADLPARRKFGDADQWHIGVPDLIVTLPQDLPVPAIGSDQWRDVGPIDSGLTEDRYIKAVETRATKGLNVVHHAVASMDGFTGRGEDYLLLYEYSIGKNGDVYPEGVGRLMKAGTKIVFNMHTYSVGQDLHANVALGLTFYPKGYVPKHPLETGMVGYNTSLLDIPPNTTNVRVDGYSLLTKPTRLLSFQPHMHSRGSAMCVEAIYPPAAHDSRDGTVNKDYMRPETLSCVNRFTFGWAIDYHYADDVQPLLPAGTVLHVTGWHNNTKGNRFNSDSDNLITWGPRTIDDMSFAWMNWISLSDQEFKQQVEERKHVKLTNSEAQPQ